MPCIHTCELEFNIFFLHWDIIHQKISQWLPIQILRKSLTVASIVFFDIIADKAH